MNPRRFRYCLLAAALAVAFWRSPVASPTNGLTEGTFGATNSSEPSGRALPAPPAPLDGRDAAALGAVKR